MPYIADYMDKDNKYAYALSRLPAEVNARNPHTLWTPTRARGVHAPRLLGQTG